VCWRGLQDDVIVHSPLSPPLCQRLGHRSVATLSYFTSRQPVLVPERMRCSMDVKIRMTPAFMMNTLLQSSLTSRKSVRPSLTREAAIRLTNNLNMAKHTCSNHPTHIATIPLTQLAGYGLFCAMHNIQFTCMCPNN